MGVREQMNEKPRLMAALTAVVVVLVVGYIYMTMRRDGIGSMSTSGQVYFTDDDGKSWFADDAKKVPPFDHNGKEASRAYVYRCDGTTFVSHMEKYTPQAKKLLESYFTKGPQASDPSTMQVVHSGTLVKAPGGKAWVKATDPQARPILQPKCPNGAGTPEMLVP